MSTQTQRDRIFWLLKTRQDKWIPLPKLMKLAANYTARISELRVTLLKQSEGFTIENKTEVVNGVRHSFYSLRSPGKQGQLWQ